MAGRYSTHCLFIILCEDADFTDKLLIIKLNEDTQRCFYLCNSYLQFHWKIWRYVINLLLGVFVVGPGNQGILLEHREAEFGDISNATQVMEAVELMKQGAKL